jgi:hypothetical protein
VDNIAQSSQFIGQANTVVGLTFVSEELDGNIVRPKAMERVDHIIEPKSYSDVAECLITYFTRITLSARFKEST